MFKNILIFFSKGFAMGSADLVPGISGATIALVINVYQPFIRSLKRILSLETLRLLGNRKFREWAEYVNLGFILPLVAGIFTCIFSLAFVIAYLLEHQPIPFWSFFFGLILASAFVLPDYSQGIRVKKIILFVLGGVSGFLLVSLDAINTRDTSLMIFIAGMVAIGAMLLPGISGSFMLVVIGKYTTLIHAIKDVDLAVLSVFSLGAIVSLIVLPRLIEFIFKAGREWFIVFISGFLIGSLKKIWPWKLTEPVTQKDVMVSPSYYQEILLRDPQLSIALICGMLGIGLILFIRYWERKLALKTEPPIP